ncbi:uncharacterized protein LOC126898030 [Daktulosphaira vitifoliae]|uniref:uncharacterized protein LOC126898030 n=1 Tax=Daktulosphaira vitifoliae TaxID=58002 RepID=UPI0021AA764A|nr:uncharacterized protein LOC126898030 [Daktulosphaira vitifoliae]
MTISTWRDFTIVNSCDRKLRETNPRNCNAPCYHKICKQPTINRDCLIRFEHQQLLSIPKGYIYVGDRKNESDFRKCSEEKNKKIVDKNVYSQITDLLSVKSKFQNKASELDILCLIFKNLKPECESSTWKQRFTITLTYTLMKIITKDISSYQTLRSKHISTLTLKRLNRITGEQTSITSPKNKLQHVQVYLANALTPWLEKPINQICSDVKEKKQFDDQNKKSKAKFQVLTKRNLYYSKKGKNIVNTSERLIHNGLLKVSKKENFKKLIGELNDKNLNKVDNKNLMTVEIDGEEINTNKIGENGEKNLTAKENKMNDLSVNNPDMFGGINSKETHGEEIINNKPDIHSTKSNNKKNVQKESNILTLNRLGETEYFNKYDLCSNMSPI